MRTHLTLLSLVLIAPLGMGCNSESLEAAPSKNTDPSNVEERAVPFGTYLNPISLPTKFRTVDGSENQFNYQGVSLEENDNAAEEPMFWGMTETPLRRGSYDPLYQQDGQTPDIGNRPNPRDVSNTVSAQPDDLEAPLRGPTNLFWAFGQFIDHDIDLSLEHTDPDGCKESMNIPIPTGDPYFDPQGTGQAVLPFCRTMPSGSASPRQHPNAITSFLDGSNIYGSDTTRALAIRDGKTGRLLTLNTQRGIVDGDLRDALLPLNLDGLPNAALLGEGMPPAESYFLAGDVRANENVLLTAMHTVWMREHNHWIGRLETEEIFNLTDGAPMEELVEKRYQVARSIVVAELQHITYHEWLPILLGANALKTYRGFQPDLGTGILSEFSTAAFRFGHTMIPNTLRVGLDGDMEIMPVQDLFFKPSMFCDEAGDYPEMVEALIGGGSQQSAQQVDPYVVGALRNFLFGEPGQGGLDLASLNIQRGRDHGLPTYSGMREALGLDRDLDRNGSIDSWEKIDTFEEMSRDPEVQDRLSQAYANVEDVDLWVGGLSEDRRRGLMGETFHAIIQSQFQDLRDGDQFWYRIYLDESLQVAIRLNTLKLHDILLRTTNLLPEDIEEYQPRRPFTSVFVH